MFKPDFDHSRKETDDDLLFVLHGGRLLLKKNADRYDIPTLADLDSTRDQLTHFQYFGLLDKRPCFIAKRTDEKIPVGLELKDMGELFLLLDKKLILTAGCAAQLIRWDDAHQYCGCVAANPPKI